MDRVLRYLGGRPRVGCLLLNSRCVRGDMGGFILACNASRKDCLGHYLFYAKTRGHGVSWAAPHGASISGVGSEEVLVN